MAKIAIDCGHGLYTAGKRCLKSLDPYETREWVINDRVGDALAAYLIGAGHEVLRVDDTDGSTDVSLTNRASKANDWGADFYISVHHNAGIKGGTGGGTEVYTCKGCQAKSKLAQEAIYKYAIQYGKLKGNRSDGTRASNFTVLVKTKMPACLIECGFMDSATDINYILDPAWSDDIAKGIAVGICEVFGGEVSSKASVPSTSAGVEKPSVPTVTLLRGDKGTQVATLQTMLNWFIAKEYIKAGKLAVDKSYGPLTQKAVKVFQKAMKKKGYYSGKIDGSFGPLSRAGARTWLDKM